MVAGKSCIPINTNEIRFSKSTERIQSKNIYVERLFKAQGSQILVSRLLELSVLISKLLCNIYQLVFEWPHEKPVTLDLTHRLERKRPIWKAF